MALPDGGKQFDDMYKGLDKIPALDRRTELVKQYRALHAVHKNYSLLVTCVQRSNGSHMHCSCYITQSWSWVGPSMGWVGLGGDLTA